MKNRLPMALAVTALIIAVFSATGIAQAATASFALNAGKLLGFKPSKTSKKNTVVVRGANGKIDARSIPAQARGARGTAGPAGPVGPTGPKGDTGPAGAPNPNAVNSDKLDNLDSTDFARSSTEAFHAVGAAGEPGFTTCFALFSSTTWSNYPGNFNPASYYKDPWGTVHVRGLVKTAPSGPFPPSCIGPGTNIFVLPAGYRPAHEEIFATVTFNEVFGHARVQANGNVVAWTGNGNWFSLDGFSFSAGG